MLGAAAYEKVKLEFNFNGQLAELSELELAVLEKFFDATLQVVDAILKNKIFEEKLAETIAIRSLSSPHTH